MNKKTYKAPSIDRNEALVKLKLYEELPYFEGGSGVDNGLTKERDTYNNKYKEKDWGEVEKTIW